MAASVAENFSMPQSLVLPSGYETLTEPLPGTLDITGISYEPLNPDYDHYLRMHKVLVGTRGAQQLDAIRANLALEHAPRYLSAAGWAAAEVALVQVDLPAEERLAYLSEAARSWQEAIKVQKALNSLSDSEELIEHAYPHRMALDIAILPLVAGLIQGSVPLKLRRQVYEDCLNIAQSNAVFINLMARNENLEGLGEHIGFGYEVNALLSFNLRCSKGWFVLPSVARADTGVYHSQQTHDLSVVHHRGGKLLQVTPVEIKSATQRRDRERYRALLVRGKMHLSKEGKYTPDQTLAIIEAVYQGTATPDEVEVFGEITDRFVRMVREYSAGEVLGDVATGRSVTKFRDKSGITVNQIGRLGLVL